MKAFVLLNKRTGDLFEAYRVTFLDDAKDDQYMIAMTYRLVMVEQHGWILFHPLPPLRNAGVFFNNKGTQKMFENLGTLEE